MDSQNLSTELLPVDPAAPDAGAIARAAGALRSGKLVAFPTETVYGLGANALNADAVARVFAAKGRPANNPLIVHVADTDAARELVSDWPEAAAKLAARFWPGPLTLVLPRSDRVPDIVTAGGPTVALRVPSHPVALALLRAAGVPVAAPSANRSETLSPTRAAHVREGLDGRIDLILDGGATPGGVESTVLLLAGKFPRLLRPGLVKPSEIEAVVGPIRRRPPAPAAPGDAAPLASPGMAPRHYAPRALLEIAHGYRVWERSVEGEHVGWLTWYEGAFSRHKSFITVKMPRDPKEYAARLYDVLHDLDSRGVTRIVVDALPETEEWLAVNDRLRRAATKEGETGK